MSERQLRCIVLMIGFIIVFMLGKHDGIEQNKEECYAVG